MCVSNKDTGRNTGIDSQHALLRDRRSEGGGVGAPAPTGSCPTSRCTAFACRRTSGAAPVPRAPMAVHENADVAQSTDACVLRSRSRFRFHTHAQCEPGRGMRRRLVAGLWRAHARRHSACVGTLPRAPCSPGTANSEYGERAKGYRQPLRVNAKPAHSQIHTLCGVFDGWKGMQCDPTKRACTFQASQCIWHDTSSYIYVWPSLTCTPRDCRHTVVRYCMGLM